MKTLRALVCVTLSLFIHLSGCTGEPLDLQQRNFSQATKISLIVLDVRATLHLQEQPGFRTYTRNAPSITHTEWIDNDLALTVNDPVIPWLIQDGDFLGLIRIQMNSPHHNVSQELLVIGTPENPPRLHALDQEFQVAPFNDGHLLEIWGASHVFDGSAPLLASRGESRSIQEFDGEYRTGHTLAYTVPLDRAFAATFFQADVEVELNFQYSRQATVSYEGPPSALDGVPQEQAERAIEATGRLGTITIDCRATITVGYSPCLSPWMWNPMAPT